MELIPVLSTKTLSDEAIDLAHSLGLRVECIDLIKTTGLALDTSSISENEYDAVAFTSASAVKHFFGNKNAGELLQGKTIFSVAEKTAEELRYYGVSPTIIESDAADLAGSIIKTGQTKSVLHICGNLTLPALQNKLNGGGIHYIPLVVYHTTFTASKVNNSFNSILFYSPSGVKSFFSLNKIEDEAMCCCIGETTANELKEHCSNIILVPDRPVPELMLQTVAGYFKKRGGSI